MRRGVSDTVVRYEPRGAGLDLFRCKDNEVLLSGAAGTGKSVAALMKVHLTCLSVPKVRALIVRKTHSSLTASTLVTFRQKVAAEALATGAVSFYGGSAQEPAAFRYANGSVIVVGGLDRASRLLSTEYDLCFVDEAIETTPEDLDTIITRLRNGRLSYQQLILATNPGPPTHHLKQRADASRCTMLYSRHEDNPRLYRDGEWTEYGQAYLARLDSLSGARYQRMRWGKWVAAEGQIYELWDESVHLIDPVPVPSEWVRWWSIDFGYTAPLVLQTWAEDGDGRLYLLREIYHTRRLVEDHAAHILRLVRDDDGQWSEPRPRAIICDHDAEDRATLERHLGMSTVAAKKTVSDGIQAVQSRLKVAGDGKPRLFIVRGALAERDQALADAVKPTCTEEEFPGYVWAVKPGAAGGLKEEPVKQDDHGMDALRYMVAERDLGGRPRVRFM
jgi:PBSX family phage terminase large subunit